MRDVKKMPEILGSEEWRATQHKKKFLRQKVTEYFGTDRPVVMEITM
jgi:hypothetical protein